MKKRRDVEACKRSLCGAQNLNVGAIPCDCPIIFNRLIAEMDKERIRLLRGRTQLLYGRTQLL